MTKRRGCGILAVVAAWLVALPAVAAERVVVLELGNPAGLQDQETQYLSDLLRGAVSETTGARYFVLTRENLLELLPPGTSLAACVGDCEVETGRKVGADHVVSGEVVRFGLALRASLRLHDTRTGRLEGMETASAPALSELELPLKEAARRLTRRLPGLESAPAPGAAAPGDALLVAGFGADVAVPEAPAEPEPLQPPVPVTTDVALLEKLQAVRRAEAESPRSAGTCATTWRALADHPKDHPLRATATQRAEAWETTARLAKARFLALAEVRKKFETDTDTLRRYLALDRDIVSRRQKAAFVEEFRTAWTWYRPYQAMPPEVEAAPKAPAVARPVFPGGGLAPASPPNVSATPAPILLGPSGTDPQIISTDDTYWPPIVLMALGVGGMGLGLITTVVGNVQNDDFDLKNCRQNADSDVSFRVCTDSEWEVAREDAHAGDDTIDAGWTIVGLSGAMTIAGGVWYLVHPDKEPKAKKSTGRGVGAVFGPDGLTVYGRF